MQLQILNDYANCILDILSKGVEIKCSNENGIVTVSLNDPESKQFISVQREVKTNLAKGQIRYRPLNENQIPTIDNIKELPHNANWFVRFNITKNIFKNIFLEAFNNENGKTTARYSFFTPIWEL